MGKAQDTRQHAQADGAHSGPKAPAQAQDTPPAAAQTQWAVPYLTIDPEDIGRTYEAIIRINSQSGKGGVAWVLEHAHGYELPRAMQPEVSEVMNTIADREGRELTPPEMGEVFQRDFINRTAPLALVSYQTEHGEGDLLTLRAVIKVDGRECTICGTGNGPINAFVHGLESVGRKTFNVADYHSHSIDRGSASRAAAYVQVRAEDRPATRYGCGIDTSIEKAGLLALITAINRLGDA